MRQVFLGITGAAALALVAGAAGAAGPPSGPVSRCAPDAVVSGAGCMDKYEASAWRVPDSHGANRFLVRKIQQGKATVAMLEAGGATQLGVRNVDNYAPCTDGGQDCTDDVYAASLPGVPPSVVITWFQAQAACENAGKRLPSNAEWQAAVAGTPDPGEDDGTTECNTQSAFKAIATGSRPACVSARGAFDMVGNVYEWVADWVPGSTRCGVWSPSVSPTDDDQCLAGPGATGEPSALLRGGNFFSGALAGPHAVIGSNPVSGVNVSVGFRCAR